ncbi:uncharacterized protein LOC131012600 [Salvia miltiorrhiza]|uniref:uncharacterized protein LOC131012600 n=1 Tax=Salvia miltiorrhiza TaxID=226208 RepID=UPI0025AD2245|nr:uncharacterized protein LOC131012600 [Salvia miltiorrhiza]XP_057796567.1 uncharacterized protein LOC131012600 [Salvia miltiorrhiza]
MAELKFRYNPSEMNYDAYLEMKQKIKKKKQGESSGEPSSYSITTDHPIEIYSSRSRGKKVAEVDEAFLTDDFVTVALPPGASALTGYNQLSEQLEKLLLEEDRVVMVDYGIPKAFDMTVSTVFAGYQHVVYLKQLMVEREKELESLRAERVELRNELQLAKGDVEVGHKQLADLREQLQAQLATKDREISHLKAKLTEMNVTRRNELKVACFETNARARAEMTQQYLDGSCQDWETTATLKLWEDIQGQATQLSSDDGATNDD